MKDLALCQQLTFILLDVFPIFSKRDNILIFCMAKDGLKTHSSILHDEIPTKKRYYKALKRLKDAGLIEKSTQSKDIYFHTTFGSFVYQKLFVGLTELSKNKEKFKMFDTLKQANKFSDIDIQNFFERIIDIDVQNNNYEVNSLPFRPEIYWSCEKLILSMIEKVKDCKSELLLATRQYSEKVVNELILKSKVGINVKVLADTKLVQEYYKSQTNYYESNKNNEDNNIENDNGSERLKVITDPWYPNNEGIERKVIDIPFGLLVIDNKEVGIEIINRNNGLNFFAAIFIRDEKIALDVKEFYMKLWNSASDDIPLSNIVIK